MRLVTLTIFVGAFFNISLSRAQNELKTNFGHSSYVKEIDISPDGKLLLSASDDQTIRLWDLARGAEVRIFSDHTRMVNSVSFHPNGQKFASGSDDGTIKVWDLNSKEPLFTINTGDEIKSIVFSSSGDAIFSGSYTDINLWNSHDGKNIKFLGTHKGLNKLRLSPDGSRLISQGNAITLWDTNTYGIIKSAFDLSYFNDVRYNGDGSKIIAGTGNTFSDTYSLKIFDENLELVETISQPSKVESVALSPSGNLLVGAIRKKLIVRNASGDEEMSIKTGNSPYSIKFDKSGSKIYFFENSKLFFYDFDKEVKYPFSQKYSSSKISLHPNGLDFTISNMDFENGNVFFTDSKRNDVFLTSNNKAVTIKGAQTRIPDPEKVRKGKKIRSSDYVTKYETIVEFREKGGSKSSIKIEGIQFWAADQSPDGKFLALGSYNGFLALVDLSSEQLVYNKRIVEPDHNDRYGSVHPVEALNNGISLAHMSGKSKIIDEFGRLIDNRNEDRWSGSSYNCDGDIRIANWERSTSSNKIVIRNVASNDIIRELDHDLAVRKIAFNNACDYYQLAVGGFDGSIWLWDNNSSEPIMKVDAHYGLIEDLQFIGNKFLVSSGKDGLVNFWDLKKKELSMTLVALTKTNDYVVYTPDGRFDGTKNGISELYFVNGTDILPIENFYENYYTPDLLNAVLTGSELDKVVSVRDEFIPPPTVKILDPRDGLIAKEKTINLKVSAEAKQGEIDEIRVYLNGKLVNSTTRGFKTKQDLFDYNLELVEGENEIKAIALSKQRIESNPDVVKVIYEGSVPSSDLFLVAVGIDSYRNPEFNLNFAKGDASAFQELIEKNSKDIFQSTFAVSLYDENSTTQNINSTFEDVVEKAGPEDVFIFFYAGHGVMSNGSSGIDKDFYIVPHNSIKMYDADEYLSQNGISGSELRKFSRRIKAQKQLFILDACQSGGALNAVRGAAEKKAINQLARSTGSFWITASETEQFANEIGELGHGIFTYALLQGLSGEADGGKNDRKITVRELGTYVENEVPELATKHRGQLQVPRMFGFGQDFPILILKE